MSDSLSAAADLFRMIPVVIRRIIYGILGLAVVLDAAAAAMDVELLPDRIGDGLTVVFGIFGSLMALANTTRNPHPDPLA